MDLEALIRAARGGDGEAWNAIVARYSGLVWGVARAHRLTDADAADVFQTTWLRLVEHLDGIKNPDGLGSWLATTARHECLRVLRVGQRHVLTDAFELPDEDGPSPASAMLTSERDAALWRAFSALPARCQQLLRLQVADPAPSYEEISAALDMPIGSIGPTRGRCLERLRELVSAAGITVGPGEA
jgi:RNA polymerase sigma factor (sigma-70 family)